MKKYNVVLLGESHFCFKNGIEKGLAKNSMLEIKNLSLGGTSALYRLYEIHDNINIIQSSDLIIYGSNTHDTIQYNNPMYYGLNYQVINWIYKELYFLKKKVIIFLAPTPQSKLNKTYIEIVNNIHKKLSAKYGFNVINFNEYYTNRSLYDFIRRDEAHDFDFVMRELGGNIADNIDSFCHPKRIEITNDNPKFYSLKINNSTSSIKKNSMCKENIFILNDKSYYNFEEKFYGLLILGICTWNDGLADNAFCIKNSKFFYSKKINNKYKNFIDLCNRKIMISNITEINYKSGGYTNIVGFLLASPEGNYYEEQINFESLAKEIVEIPKEYNFNHLIPPVEWYKEIIDEYCMIMDPKKFSSLQEQIQKLSQEKDKVQQDNIILKQTLNSLPIKKQQLEISNLEQDLINKKLQTKQLSKKLGIKMNDFMPKITMISPSSAKTRIQNQLSYKLGQAMIINSKSILGYIRMPFVLSYIKDKHKQEQKIYQEKIKKDPSLALPPLESYPDYKEALKEKECLTYKLGEALIQANKTWYGGGYIKLLFEIRKLKREFKNR
ncbi:alpha-2,3-sialyltransferase [Campylobacter lari]|nr:alpha-2,3-sialyltransferase [Campylobacter lari]